MKACAKGKSVAMRVLLTGASGFLGGAIAARLVDEGVQVRAMGRTDGSRKLVQRFGEQAKAVQWLIADVAKGPDVIAAAEGCDALVHLAGQLTPFCQADPIAGAMVNVMGTLNIFEAARRHDIGKVVYCSSGGVFGMDDNQVPYPLTHYGAFKLANEGNARAYWLDHQIASVGFRPFVVYGPGRETGLSAGPTLACRAAARGEAYTLPLTGKIGLVYIDDVAASFCSAAQSSFDGAHVFNLPGEEVKIIDILEKIREIVPEAKLNCAGDPLPMVSTTRDDYQNGLYNVPPSISMAAGLKKTIDFYRAYSKD